MQKRHPLPFALGHALALVMLGQSLLGVLFPEAYRDPLWATSAWRGNDWVTLLVGLPLLFFSQRAARRGSTRGTLLWVGALGFGVYNYAYYLFGAALNAFFLFYVAGFLLSGAALARALHLLLPAQTFTWLSLGKAMRVTGIYFGVVGAGLAVLWIAQWIRYLATGTAPDLGPDAFRLIAALDLTLMSPLMLAAAVGTWRRAPWAAVFCVLAGVQGATYTLVLTAGSLVGARAGVAGAAAQLPLWAVLTVLNAIATALVFRREPVTSSSSPTSPATPSAAAGRP